MAGPQTDNRPFIAEGTPDKGRVCFDGRKWAKDNLILLPSGRLAKTEEPR